jgi:hypothetical protein
VLVRPPAALGGINDGHALALGCNLGYMSTRFTAATGTMAQADFRQTLIDSSAGGARLPGRASHTARHQ